VTVLRILFATLLLAGVSAGQPLLQPSCSVVPGASQVGETRHYQPENLFDYMDGNAEGYLIYGFRRLVGVTCQAGEARYVIDIFEMESPEMAYGVFAANRHPASPVKRLGMVAQITERRAILAKGNYYVEVSASPAGNYSESFEKILSSLASQLPGTTELPPQLGWFPPDGLDESSIRLVPQSVLGVRALRRGYVARYDYGRAFIVEQPSPEEAASALQMLAKRMAEPEPVKLGEEGYRGTDRYLGPMVVARKGRFVFGFTSLKGRDGVAEAGALAERIP